MKEIYVIQSIENGQTFDRGVYTSLNRAMQALSYMTMDSRGYTKNVDSWLINRVNTKTHKAEVVYKIERK